MRFQSFISPIAFALTAIVLLCCQSNNSKTDSAPSSSSKIATPPYTTVTLTTQEFQKTQLSKKATDKVLKPFRLSSRFHLKNGTNEGYLIVKVELPDQSYIYSLTQPEPFPKTKISVASSPHFSLTSKQSFTPDRSPKIIEKDPDFGARLEKHSGIVQFVVPIEMNKTISAKELQIQIELDGQVCDEVTCLPFFRKKTTAKFAGFYDPTEIKHAAPQNAKPKNN